ALQPANFEIVKYNNPDAVADLGVGLWAWPLPMDYDLDGDMDLVVSCPDYPFNGLYFFENTLGGEFPIFAPPVRIGDAIKNVQLSYIDDKPRILRPGEEIINLNKSFGTESVALFPIDSILKDFKK